MRRRLITLAIPASAALFSWFVVPLSSWSDLKSGLLTALSVIAAAVMVRLARGLPFTNADHFEVDEIKAVAAAIKQIMRSLQALIAFILGTMVLLTFAERVPKAILSIGSSEAISTLSATMSNAMSALCAFATVFVLLRIMQVVRGDYSLVELQSKFMIRAVERKQVEKFEKERGKSKDEIPFQAPSGFGRFVSDQPH